MANTNDIQTPSTLDLTPAPSRPIRRRLAGGAALLAIGAGFGWLGGAATADTTVAAVPRAVSSPRSPDAVERSALPDGPAAVSSSRSPDAIARSSEIERQASIAEADCLRWSQGSAEC